MIKTFIHNGHLITASSKQEAISKITASSNSNICVYIDDKYNEADDLYEYVPDILINLNKKVAYFDAERKKIACKDMKIANLIKKRLFKRLDGAGEVQEGIKIGKSKTDIFLTSGELVSWVKKTYKNLLTMDANDTTISLIQELPSEAFDAFDRGDDLERGDIIDIESDDFFGTEDVVEMRGLLVKGKLNNIKYFTYDPIHEDFSFDEIKKLIDANLIKMKELINNYKNKQLNIVEKECNPILAKLNSIVK